MIVKIDGSFAALLVGLTPIGWRRESDSHTLCRNSTRELERKSLVTTVMKYVNCKSKVLPRAGGIILISISLSKGNFQI